MKRIEAVVTRSALEDFHRCARQLGIFGFDLSEDDTSLGEHQRAVSSNECTHETSSKVRVDFAVLDEEINPIIHAVLESVHPDSIAIFKFEQKPDTEADARRNSP
jgi:nitrogen regulatory protein PII